MSLYSFYNPERERLGKDLPNWGKHYIFFRFDIGTSERFLKGIEEAKIGLSPVLTQIIILNTKGSTYWVENLKDGKFSLSKNDEKIKKNHEHRVSFL